MRRALSSITWVRSNIDVILCDLLFGIMIGRKCDRLISKKAARLIAGD